MAKYISKNKSFDYWNVVKLLKGNKEFVKTLISFGLGATGYLVTGGYIESGLAAILSKFTLDILDFYFSKVELK